MRFLLVALIALFSFSCEPPKRYEPTHEDSVAWQQRWKQERRDWKAEGVRKGFVKVDIATTKEVK